MLENIKKIIPEMEKSDSQSFYNNAIKSKQPVKFSLPKKLVISFASVIILLAICIPVGMNLWKYRDVLECLLIKSYWEFER